MFKASKKSGNLSLQVVVPFDTNGISRHLVSEANLKDEYFTLNKRNNIQDL